MTVPSPRAQLRLIVADWMGRNDCTSFIRAENIGTPAIMLDPDYTSERAALRMRVQHVHDMWCYVEGVLPVDELIDDLVKAIAAMKAADVLKLMK